jgi:iron complex transport system ATP-binding protein
LTIGYHHPRREAVVVAAGLNLELRGGELVCLLGPNGAGKSTLMRTIAGLQPALSGDVRLAGDPPSELPARELARRLSIVLTERVDPGNLSAWDLVALGRHPYTDWWGNLTEADHQVVTWAIRAVGGGNLAHRPVTELSDGERQKFMVARALAQQPMLMLLDEPTAFLDLPRRVEIMGLLRRLARETGQAILLSTHDLDLALRSADRLWLLSSDGVMQTGAPEDLILSGGFERVFASEGVTFDPYTGSFRMVRETAGVIRLRGEGMTGLWTTRALEREGFCVDPVAPQAGDDASAHPLVAVETDDGGTCWRLHRPGEADQSFASLHGLLQALRGDT